MSDEIETAITQTNESVPEAEETEKAASVKRVKPYEGPIHLDDANQIIPAAKPKARHESDVDADGRKQREEAAAGGWPPSAINLTQPLAIGDLGGDEGERNVKAEEAKPAEHHHEG